MNILARQGVYERILFSIMKTKPLARFATLLVAAACITSCTVTPQKRIEKNPQLYSALSNRDKTLVSQGRIDKGMSREAVFLAWGNPDRVQVGEENGRNLERWGYLDRYPVTTHQVGVGFGAGRWGWGGGFNRWGCDPFWGGGFGGPVTTFIPYEAGSVEFKSGRVQSWRAIQ